MLTDLDEGTRQDLDQSPRLMAQLALLARITARLGIVGSLRLTCPYCQTVDALLIDLRSRGHASCYRCHRQGALSELLKDRDHLDEVDKIMRSKPRR